MLSTLLMALVMAAMTLAAGWAPFYIPVGAWMAWLSPLSAGVILGTTFALVLPECYEAFEMSLFSAFLIILGFLLMLVLEVGFVNHKNSREAETNEAANSSVPVEIVASDPKTWFRGISMSSLGMTVHAAADGIALGATSGNSQALVFVAILLHKAPAAFGLTTLLLTRRNLPTLSCIRRDVTLFSVAGPIMAIVLSGITTAVGGSDSAIAKTFAGSCLALSGGTFVYVAVHVLDHTRATEPSREVKLVPLALVAGGTLLPVLVSLIPE